MKRRKIFGVIAATAADTEQREVLNGIIEKAHSMNIDIAVMSNIYNPLETAELLKTENIIYRLIRSDEFDGLILVSEAILNIDVQKVIISELSQKDVPIVAVGTEVEGFTLPSFHYVNTSDENDIEDVCDHLIDVHGFTDIHILSGDHDRSVSHKRVSGYRRSLEKHGIAFDENKVFFGNFWLNTGHAHAKRYLSGELPYPQALICCNDYMAFGLLDEFLEKGININEKMSVIGYEYIRERSSHFPLLTTYQRNRRALGSIAVELLAKKLENGSYETYTPPKGRIVCGDTCSCGSRLAEIKNDIKFSQVKTAYDSLNMFSQLEHRLMECRNMVSFVSECRNSHYMLRDVDKLFLCLYENWFDDSENSENMLCHDLLAEKKPFLFRKHNISAVFRNEASHYYFCPLFFSDRELGYVVMGFQNADTFGYILRDWLKTIANALEFLRMKNDIQFYLQCQDMSEKRDPMTGMLNESGLRNEYRNASKSGLCFVALRIGLVNRQPYGVSDSEHICAVLDAAEAVKQFSGNQISAKINEDTFVCLMRDIPDTQVLERQLSALLIHHSAYMKKHGLDSFVCSAVSCDDEDYSQVSRRCFEKLAEMTDKYSARRTQPHYKKLNKLRLMFYDEPQMTFDSRDVYSKFGGSDGYLRAIFRKCYGFTLHDDCTNARIAAARYYITMSKLSNAEIAEKCGYKDLKYFLRQFQQVSGYTVLQYRKMWS